MKLQSKKKILFVIPAFGGGGAERVILQLLNNIDRKRYIPHLLTLFDTKHSYLTFLKEDVIVEHLSIPVDKKYFFWHTFRAIIKQRPEVVFMGLSGISVLISPFIRFFPKIKWIVRETNTVSLHVKNRRMLFLYRNFYKNYHVIIAQCHDMEEDLVKHFNIPAKKISVIHNPIDSSFIKKRLELEEKVDYAVGKINLLACGRLSHQKGFDILIKALSKVKNKEMFHLTIAGDTKDQEYENKLRSLVANNNLSDMITFVGYQSNIYNWLSQADVFILSSRYEGFPNVVLESLYCGTPVLANNCRGGINEIIEEGQNGYIFDFSENSFEKKLMTIIETKFESQMISKNTLKKFGIDSIMRKYEQVLMLD